MQPIKIFRDEKNAFGEPEEKQYIGIVEAYYYQDKNDISISLNDRNIVNEDILEYKTLTPNYIEKILTSYNEDSLKIKEKDYFYYNDTKYEIIDKCNVQDIVFDMIIHRR
ncbi:hypothetical protein RBU49_01570 [Clostridium sp. MB40-C1]|uniref:hypothetical protein n=1 Tax=Clostridium sp. MB40-C1 TaxID=3070996 RepID=UPI0027E1A4DC|nr:hypothetical protein [Clostridium sp. MB40-C1]WMJ80967.1 hypothetical protein RBU49_01570 [Clostridium sp. MB40-C1]